MYGLLKCVKKRSGEIQDFDIGKLQKTILVTIEEEKEFNEPFSVAKSATSRMSFEVVDRIEKEIKQGNIDGNCIDVETVQNTVEDVFYCNGYHNTAKNYMRFKFDKVITNKDQQIKLLTDENTELKRFKEKYLDDMR